jgi:hypothetical protein
MILVMLALPWMAATVYFALLYPAPASITFAIINTLPTIIIVWGQIAARRSA